MISIILAVALSQASPVRHHTKKERHHEPTEANSKFKPLREKEEAARLNYCRRHPGDVSHNCPAE